MLRLLFDFFGGKAKTRIYTTFLGWVLVFHIDIVFIALFIDQTIIFQKTTQLKGEYVLSYISELGWILEITRLAWAGVLTRLMIWDIPKLINVKSYKAELEVEYSLRKMKLLEEEKLSKKETSIVTQQRKNIEAEKEVAVERAKLDKTPAHISWDLEFDDFIKIRNGEKTLKEISHTVYAEGGNLYQYTGVDGWVVAPTGVTADNLALADTNGLINFTDKSKMLNLTEKGKYFIKKLSSL